MARKKIPELRIVECRTEEVRGHLHVVQVQLLDGSVLSADDVKKVIAEKKGTFTMVLPETAAAYEKQKDTPLTIQVQQCPDCLDEVLFA